MNNNAKKWVEALRSGEFTQAQRTLQTKEQEYCCLGVACELYRRETGEGEWIERFDVSLTGLYFAPGNKRHGSNSFLPPVVQEWIGLNGAAGEFDDSDINDDSTTLAEMNDEGNTFDQIATVIEQEPEGLFA